MSIQAVSKYSSFKTRIKKDYRKIKFSKSEAEYLNKYKTEADYADKKPLLWGMKRAVDILSGAFGMIVSAPILLVSAVAIKLDSKGPVLFKQKRIGKDGKPFNIYKLRTMYDDKANDGYNVISPDDKRITKVGKVLRKYSIDECPQFYNIFKGDISLIGPRPITEYEHKKAHDFPEFAGRYAVKPGVKLKYGKNLESKKRFFVEKEYIQNWSPKKDINTLFSIVKDVLNGNNY